MTTSTRILPAVLMALLAVGNPAQGQFRSPATPAPSIPSMPPATRFDPETPAPRTQPNPVDKLNKLTTPTAPAASMSPDPLDTLSSPPLPPGAYASPWYTDGPGCVGPMGKHGPVNYDLFWQTGPVIPFGSGAFTDRLHIGWNVGLGGRSLFFNREGTAAWAIDLGLNYTYNRASNDDFLDVFVRQPALTGANNRLIPQADLFETVRIRALHRTAFTYGIGRDWFLWGDGNTGSEADWNFRIGTDVGGRWGTAHVDLDPLTDPSITYSRRQKVFHGVYLGLHTNLEFPMGGWIGFIGTRAEWSYDWMNIIPPLKGDVQNINLLLTGGVRY